MPLSYSYAKESIGEIFDFKKISVNSIDNIKIKKLSSSIENNVNKVATKKDKNEKDEIGVDEAKQITKDLLKEFFKVDLSNVKLRCSEELNNIFEVFGDVNGENKYVVKINKKGIVLYAYLKDELKANSKSKLNVDESKKLVEKFIEEYLSHQKSDIKLVLTNRSNNSNNLHYKIQRTFNNIPVLEEGGEIVLDQTGERFLSLNINWSNINFEKELTNKLTKNEAINILSKSKEVSPYYVKKKNEYVLDFVVEKGKEYLIDVNANKIKSLFESEYIVEKNNTKSLKDINKKSKSNEEIKKLAEEIVYSLTEKKGKAISAKLINENNKKFIKCVVLSKKEKYFIEYDEKGNKVLNIYKDGDIETKIKNKDIDFETAYKTAIKSVGLIYNDKVKNLNFTQAEKEILNGASYNFVFNRIYNDIDVKDQYVSVNINGKTGEVDSMFIEWDDNSKFNNSKINNIENIKKEYLQNLKGNYIYINEYGTGRLYYSLKDSITQ